jgi:DNA-binding transcriptional MerR regulator
VIGVLLLFEEDTMPSKTKTISEMCAEFGVTPRTLRFYEAKELISPDRNGSHRLFSKSDRVRMKLIQRGKRFGFSLEEIRQLLDLYHLGDLQYTQLTKTYNLAVERLGELRARRKELDQVIKDLQDQLKWGEKVLASFKHQTAAE